jgi:hypothetical protein
LDYKKRFKNGIYSYIDPAEYKKKDKNIEDEILMETEMSVSVNDFIEYEDGSDSL